MAGVIIRRQFLATEVLGTNGTLGTHTHQTFRISGSSNYLPSIAASL